MGCSDCFIKSWSATDASKKPCPASPVATRRALSLASAETTTSSLSCARFRTSSCSRDALSVEERVDSTSLVWKRLTVSCSFSLCCCVRLVNCAICSSSQAIADSADSPMDPVRDTTKR